MNIKNKFLNNKKNIVLYLTDFGDEQLGVILEHYTTSLKSIDTNEAVLEWTALKSSLYTR